jgi:hypothetical protein
MNKINILLDIDNTILCSQDISSFEKEKEKKKDKYNELNKHTIKGFYKVFERPYLQEFLEFIFENFNVSIWTAATEEYASFVIKNIIKSEKLKSTLKEKLKLNVILHSDHCKISTEKGNGIKDLSLLWECNNPLHLDSRFKKTFKSYNTFILDDYREEVYEKNKNNCILVEPFDYENENCHKDKYLKNLKKSLTKFLKEGDNKDLQVFLKSMNSKKDYKKHKSGSGKSGMGFMKKSKTKTSLKTSLKTKTKTSLKSSLKSSPKPKKSKKSRKINVKKSIVSSRRNDLDTSKIIDILKNIRKRSSDTKTMRKSRKSKR